MSSGRLPHARGGVSWLRRFSIRSIWSSPRPWGCFLVTPLFHSLHLVFPTPVGVFPLYLTTYLLTSSLPHARGGVSISIRRNQSDTLSSPRPWGCFIWVMVAGNSEPVFPTPVGVFLKAYPYACRKRWSSPRPWGCFPSESLRSMPRIVFPTPVGVFPPPMSVSTGGCSLPHARGGVSIRVKLGLLLFESSPRPWGCFYLLPARR